MPNVYGDQRAAMKAVEAAMREMEAQRSVPEFEGEIGYKPGAWIFSHFDSRGGSSICFAKNAIAAINRYVRVIYGSDNERGAEKDSSINNAYDDLEGRFEVVVIGDKPMDWKTQRDLDVGYSEAGDYEVPAVSEEEADALKEEAINNKHGRSGFRIVNHHLKIRSRKVHKTVRAAIKAAEKLVKKMRGDETRHPEAWIQPAEGSNEMVAYVTPERSYLNDPFPSVIPTKILTKPVPDGVYRTFRVERQYPESKDWHEVDVLVLIQPDKVPPKNDEDEDEDEETVIPLVAIDEQHGFKYRAKSWELGEDAFGLVLF